MPLTDNLISFWELEEASGTRNDSHSTNHLTGGVPPPSATGKVGNAANFEHDSSHILSIADNVPLSCPATSFTIAGWVNFESKVSGDAVMIAKFQSNAEWSLDYRGTEDRLRIVIFDGDGFSNPTEVFANNLGSPSLATWYFIVAWYDRDADILGIQVNDGTADTVAATVDSYDSLEPFCIGGNTGFSQYFDGLIDQVGFWKRALTSGERTQLYNSGNGLSYAALSGSGSNSVSSERGIRGLNRGLMRGLR